MEKYNEKEVIALLQDSSRYREAFEQIVRQYSEQLYWQIRRMVFNHDDANDILQNTFLRAWDHIEYFRGESKLSTWLYRIAFNETLAFLNKERAAAHISIDEMDSQLLNQLESDEYFDGDDNGRKMMARQTVQKIRSDYFNSLAWSGWNGKEYMI